MIAEVIVVVWTIFGKFQFRQHAFSHTLYSFSPIDIRTPLIKFLTIANRSNSMTLSLCCHESNTYKNIPDKGTLILFGLTTLSSILEDFHSDILLIILHSLSSDAISASSLRTFVSITGRSFFSKSFQSCSSNQDAFKVLASLFPDKCFYNFKIFLFHDNYCSL